MMLPRKPLAVVTSILLSVGAVACSAQADASTATSSTVSADSGAATSSSATSSSAVTSTDSSASSSSDTASSAMPGGPGQTVSVSSVTTMAQLDALIQEAYGDASLGLHRGHQPVESTLIDVLGITHEEMHVRMDAGQNLAAVATDLGIDPQTLIDALVDSWSPAIDNLLAAGTITQDQADAYHAALEEAFTFKVTWDGQEATPTFTGV